MSMLRHPYLLLATVALFWGGNAVAGKLAADHVSPMALTLLRWIVAIIAVAPFAMADVRRDWPVIRTHLGRLLLLGGIGFAGFNGALYLALTYTSPINVTIEQSAMPLFVFMANYLLFRTRVFALQIAGFALTIIGVIVAASHGSLSALLGLDLNRGDALMLLAVVIYGGYTVALRLKPDIHWRSAILCLSVGAAIASVPLALIEFAIGAFDAPDAIGWSVIVYAAILPGIVAQTFYMRGVDMIGPNRANLFINMVPIFGAILAVGFLGEVLFAYHVAALGFVIAGISLAEFSVISRQRSEQKTAPTQAR